MLKALATLVLLAVAHSPGAGHAHEPDAVDVIIYTTQGELPLSTELAANPEARALGLMHRDTLKPHDGMLFVFPKAADYRFWMKDTRLPLDMLFVDAEQTIVHIEENAKPYSLTERHAGRPVLAVIELDGGASASKGIAKGDKVRYALPKMAEIY